MKRLVVLADRTAVLFLGVAVGIAIGYAFVGDRTPLPPPVVAVTPDSAPPPPTASARPGVATPAVAGMPPATVCTECAAPKPASLVERLASGGKVRIGVFGDSFGDGVWSGLYRQLSGKDGFEVVKFSQQSTGFTRYRSLNLEEHDRGRLAEQPVDIAVISFGANDTQGVMHEGHAAPLMSPAWQAEIGGRVDRYVAMLRAQGATVYWVGLPRMRKPSFDADIAAMNDFYTRRMAALGVPFIDTRPYSSDAGGQYAAYLPNPKTGDQMLMRANDGIHMSMNGYVRITKGLADRIRNYVDTTRRQAGIAVPASPTAPSPAKAAAAPDSGGPAT